MNENAEQNTSTATMPDENHSRAGKYLTFQLASEEYGVEILKVREIIGLMEITNVPQTPHYIRGVINLRGKVIPVLDLRAKFGMDLSEDTDQTCIVVVEVDYDGAPVQTGLVVDAVSEVLDVEENQVEDTPEFGGGVETSYILGIGKVNNEVKILLDIEKVIDAREMSSIGKSRSATHNSVAEPVA